MKSGGYSLRTFRNSRNSLIDKFLEELREKGIARSGAAWRDIARPAQLPPPGDWSTWIFEGGRGAGKTRTGAEFILEEVAAGRTERIHLVAPTVADYRDVMVEGPAGILTVASNSSRPEWLPSRRRLDFPNGTVALCFSADEPDRLRGPQCGTGWLDEICAWKYPAAAFDMFMFGLRMGKSPRVLITTTPRPIKLLREIKALPSTVLTKSTTYENRDNLAESFFSQIITKYEGTRLGRQEILGEVLEDNPGALWNLTQIDNLRVTEPPELSRIVVAIDPAITSNPDSDETGIIIAARGRDKHGYVLGDWSQISSPDTWARAAIRAFHQFKADRIVAEVNQGGDMVETIIRTVDRNVPYRAVHASRGKSTRAEPIAALYEQGRIHHIGTHAGLEDQMIQWDPVASKDSPDRVDALVWSLTDLMLDNVEKGIRWL